MGAILCGLLLEALREVTDKVVAGRRRKDDVGCGAAGVHT
jgi:hypothetical protein